MPPDSLVTPAAVTIAGGVGWLIKHFTTRSTDRATALRGRIEKRKAENAGVVARAIEGFEKQVAGYQQDLSASRAEVTQLRAEQCERDKLHEQRLGRLERKIGRMHTFVLEIYTAYVDIRAYAGVLDVKLAFHVPEWKGREFKDIKLPNFENDPPA